MLFCAKAGEVIRPAKIKTGIILDFIIKLLRIKTNVPNLQLPAPNVSNNSKYMVHLFGFADLTS